jgi:hypothetical protein
MSIPQSMKDQIKEETNIDISHINSVPMRWIKGDTLPHIDRGNQSFQNTFLMYLTDSSGSLVLDGTSYPISRGSAYKFNEGLPHETIDTGYEPRLLLGPMSEQGLSVGRPDIWGNWIN